MSFKLNGTAALISSGSSSEAKVDPLPERASPSRLMANFLTEQPLNTRALTNRTTQGIRPRRNRGGCAFSADMDAKDMDAITKTNTSRDAGRATIDGRTHRRRTLG